MSDAVRDKLEAWALADVVRPVPLPEEITRLTGKIYVRPMSGDDADAYLEHVQRGESVTRDDGRQVRVNYSRVHGLVAAACLCDEIGALLYTGEDRRERAGALPITVLEPVCNLGLEISGFGEAGADAKKKDWAADPS